MRTITLPYALGDTVWWARVEGRTVEAECEICGGVGQLTVRAAFGEREVKCPGCVEGTRSMWAYFPAPVEVVLEDVTWTSGRVTYDVTGGVADARELYETMEEALSRSGEMANERNAREISNRAETQAEAHERAVRGARW